MQHNVPPILSISTAPENARGLPLVTIAACAPPAVIVLISSVRFDDFAKSTNLAPSDVTKSSLTLPVSMPMTFAPATLPYCTTTMSAASGRLVSHSLAK